MRYTITHDEGAQGWTSFHSFKPDWMQRLNNRFFTVKDGQLYLHNDETNSVRNNFYGEQFPTTVKMLFNEAPSEIKFAKTIKLESNKPFGINVKSYINDEDTSITETTLATSDFLDKEGLFHAFLRRNEIDTDLTAKNVYGVGRVDSVAGSVITFTGNIVSNSLAIGDELLDDGQNSVGIVQSYTANTITVDTTPILVGNTFIIGRKNSRIEGSEIRGYNFEVDLTDETTSRTELFAVNLGMSKSHPS